MPRQWILGATYGAVLFLGAGEILFIFRRPEPVKDLDAGMPTAGYTPPDLESPTSTRPPHGEN